MNDIYFVDSTVRTGPQALWASRMTTAMMLPIAPIMDEAGFKVIEMIAPVHMEVCVRYLRENPWERIRLLRKAIQKTPLGANVRGKSLTGMNIVPDSVLALWVKRLVANGIGRIGFHEALHDWSIISEQVRVAKEEGVPVWVVLLYVLSPVHTDEYYAQKAAEMAKSLKPDICIINDGFGILTPERMRTLVPAIQRNIGGIPVEFGANCTTGVAPLCYVEAMKLGINTFRTCVSPLANGPSLPSLENTIANARRLGYTPHVDEKVVEAISAHFRYVARREGKPIGVPVEYDVFPFSHQVPGNMVTHLEDQLGQRGMRDRLEEVLEEISVIREEWGYPTMITPYSQLVGTQAVLNVTLGERYKEVPEEVIRYLLGHYAKPAGPVDQNVVDKVTSLPGAKALLNWERPQPSIEDLRREMGRPGISDDEFLLRFLLPQEHVDAMLAAGPIKTDYPRGDKPVMALIHELTRREDSTYVHVQKGSFSLTLQRR